MLDPDLPRSASPPGTNQRIGAMTSQQTQKRHIYATLATPIRKHILPNS